MGAMTRLDAVNQMLLYSGESIVSDLEGQSGVDTSIAEFLLDSKTADYQERGLASNQRVEQVYPAANGTIKVRTDASSVTCLTPPVAVTEPLAGQLCRIVTRGGYLYNLTDDTNLFIVTEIFDLHYTLVIKWVDMDTPVQKAIVMQASREYQMMSQGDGQTDQYLQQLEAQYVTKAKGSDTNAKGYSIIRNGTGPVQRMMYGRHMFYNPNEARYYNGDL
tara:strand:+ start:6225 stop:6881 length:657 start_codon:yes stop_codon:yes gene_type:complete